MGSTAAIPSYEQARARQRSEVAVRCKIAADVCAFAMSGQASAVNGGGKL